jgi:hypothetical protein
MMETNEGAFTPNKFVDGEITFQTCWFREAPLYISSKIPNVNP